ncbi:MAG: hypothetical protein PQJ58_12470 [Spirochaetales bacterium]|nr:hypothetical protein [Spirochaetales bacterium]
MSKKLWFLTQNDEIVEVFDDRDIAVEERIYLKEENPLDDIFLHSVGLNVIANYPDEFDFARERGALNV